MLAIECASEHPPGQIQTGTAKVAVLIPALGACVSRMTSGEKRLAERLEEKLDDDYLLWYDVPVGPKQTHPDFVIIHPRRGMCRSDKRTTISKT